MLPDRVSNPGPLTYESGALPIALRGSDTTDEVWTQNVNMGASSSSFCELAKCIL